MNIKYCILYSNYDSNEVKVIKICQTYQQAKDLLTQICVSNKLETYGNDRDYFVNKNYDNLSRLNLNASTVKRMTNKEWRHNLEEIRATLIPKLYEKFNQKLTKLEAHPSHDSLIHIKYRSGAYDIVGGELDETKE